MIQLTSTFAPKSVEAEAKRRFDAFVENNKTALLPDDYKGSVFKILLKSPDAATRQETFDSLVSIMRDSKTEQPHRLAVFRTIGQVDDLELKKSVLDMTLIPTGAPNF